MGKQYAILRVQKCKGAAIGAMQYHNDREPGKHANPDIDQTRTRLNREMRPHVDYEREVQARIDDGYSGERKVRKDAVKLVEGIVTASPEFFARADDDKVRKFSTSIASLSHISKVAGYEAAHGWRRRCTGRHHPDSSAVWSVRLRAAGGFIPPVHTQSLPSPL